MSVSQIPPVLPYTFNISRTAESIIIDFYVELIKLGYTVQLVKVWYWILYTPNQGFTYLPKKKDPPQNPKLREGDFGQVPS
jgi:hypothetical protein